MYKIGEFSKMVDIPTRTLRYYDECGVLQPNQIDNFTNYRYYTDENIDECNLIKLMKSVGFTLEEIITYKDCLNEQVIEQREMEIYNEIELRKAQLDRLAKMKEKVKTNDKVYALRPRKFN